jgi:hypothetical protein
MDATDGQNVSGAAVVYDSTHVRLCGGIFAGGSSSPMVIGSTSGWGLNRSANLNIVVFLSVPITGWSSTGNGSNNGARYYASSTSLSGSLTTINWTTQSFLVGNITYASGAFTVNSTGYYQVNFQLAVAGTFALNSTIDAQIQVAGVAVSESNFYAAAAITSGIVEISDIIYVTAAQTVQAQVSTSSTGPSIVSSNTKNYMSIKQI